MSAPALPPGHRELLTRLRAIDGAPPSSFDGAPLWRGTLCLAVARSLAPEVSGAIEAAAAMELAWASMPRDSELLSLAVEELAAAPMPAERRVSLIAELARCMRTGAGLLAFGARAGAVVVLGDEHALVERFGACGEAWERACQAEPTAPTRSAHLEAARRGLESPSAWRPVHAWRQALEASIGSRSA